MPHAQGGSWAKPDNPARLLFSILRRQEFDDLLRPVSFNAPNETQDLFHANLAERLLDRLADSRHPVAASQFPPGKGIVSSSQRFDALHDSRILILGATLELRFSRRCE